MYTDVCSQIWMQIIAIFTYKSTVGKAADKLEGEFLKYQVGILLDSVLPAELNVQWPLISQLKDPIPGRYKFPLLCQLMSSSLQWNVLLKTSSHFLYALLVIFCIILPCNIVGTFQTRRCESGLFLHVNPETRTRVCCKTVPLPKGYEYISCEENGTHDRIEKCPEGLNQVDNTTTASEAKCTSEIECNPEENLKISNCDAQGHCIFTCVCNYNKGYCGENFYDCQSFPGNCPKKWVQKDCSCKWKPSLASSTLGSSTDKQNIITTQPNIPTSKPREKKDETTIGEDNNVPVNGMGDLPDQKLRGLQQHEIIILVIFVVGIPAGIAGLAVYWWSQRNRQYQSVDHSDGSNNNNGSHSGGGGGGGCSATCNIPDSVVTIQLPEEVIDHSDGLNDKNSSHGGVGGGGTNSDTGNTPGDSHTGADNGAGYGGCIGSRKRSVAVVKPQLMGISSSALREMSMEGYSEFTWSVLDNPTEPPDDETALKVVENLQKQDDVASGEQISEEDHVEKLHTNSI